MNSAHLLITPPQALSCLVRPKSRKYWDLELSSYKERLALIGQ
jgi:hypothetical protein